MHKSTGSSWPISDWKPSLMLILEIMRQEFKGLYSIMRSSDLINFYALEPQLIISCMFGRPNSLTTSCESAILGPCQPLFP